jgi:hypothetical protein
MSTDTQNANSIIESDDLISANEAAKIINRSRSFIERLQKSGKLKPTPTEKPFYHFKMSDVLSIKESLTSKSQANEKV